MNVRIGNGQIHKTNNDGSKIPSCGGNRPAEAYRVAHGEVTCKNCLKLMAAEAEVETVADEVTEIPAVPVDEAVTNTETSPIVSELNGRPAVWMVLHEGRQMWAAKDAPGLYTSKERATAAQWQAAARARQTVTEALVYVQYL